MLAHRRSQFILRTERKCIWCQYQRFFAAWLRISPNILTNWNILRITFYLLLYHYTRSSCIVVRTFNLFFFHFTFSLFSLFIECSFFCPPLQFSQLVWSVVYNMMEFKKRLLRDTSYTTIIQFYYNDEGLYFSFESHDHVPYEWSNTSSLSLCMT